METITRNSLYQKSLAGTEGVSSEISRNKQDFEAQLWVGKNKAVLE